MVRAFRSRLHNSLSARRIASNIGWLFSDKVYSTVISFVVSIFVARYLGASDFGLFNYALAFVALFRVVSHLGLEEILVRDLVRYPEHQQEILGSAFLLRLVGGFIAIGLIAVTVQFARPHDAAARDLVMIASVLCLGQALTLLKRWNTSQLLAKYNVLSNNISLTLISLTKGLLIYLGASLIWFVGSNVLVVWMTAALLLWFYLHSGHTVRTWRFRWRWAKQMFGDAWPRIPAGVAGPLQSQLGVLLIGSMISDKQLGIYAVAFRFYSLLLVVPNIFCQSLAPMLTEAHQADPSLFHRRLARTYQLLLLVFAATLIPIAALAFWGIGALYGDQYAPAGRLLFLFTLPLLLNFITQTRMWFIVIENMLRYAMVVSFVQIGVTVVANYLLIRWLGVAGAVLAIAASSMVCLLCDAIVPRARVNLIALFGALRVNIR